MSDDAPTVQLTVDADSAARTAGRAFSAICPRASTCCYRACPRTRDRWRINRRLSRASESRPPRGCRNGATIVEEAPSYRPALQRHVPIVRRNGFFTMASGGLGYGLPAAVGIALADRDQRVVAVIGDGSLIKGTTGSNLLLHEDCELGGVGAAPSRFS